jgi:NAD(P)-dependent dehydrogenase (short-subunit alcohol dehydrogenase family)
VGEGIAKRLAAEGASVMISGRRDIEGERVVREIADAGGDAAFQRADMGCEADCLKLIHATKEKFDRVDILVNNAAILAQHPFEELTTGEWDEAFAANVRGPFLCSRAAIPYMKEAGGGSIVNIGTCMAYRGPLDRIAYAASKGALLNLTKSMAGDLIRYKIRVNWITVGWVASPQELALRNITHGDGEKFLRESAERRPLGRHETADDIAAGVLFLVSDDGSHVTGCELNISGGIRI